MNDDRPTAAAVDAPELDPRVLMAAERTLLAWIRTGVAMMGFGFVVARFGLFLRELALASGSATPHPHTSPIIGTALILLGAAAIAVSIVDHAATVKRYERGLPMRARLLSPATALAAMLAAAGVGLAAYLLLV